MKKIILTLSMIVFFNVNVEAKETCTIKNLEKVCVEKTSKNILEKSYLYQDVKLKNLLKYEYQKFDTKGNLLYQRTKDYYQNTKLKTDRQYYYDSNFKYVKKSYNSKGKIISSYEKIKYPKKYTENTYQYDAKGKYVNREYYEKNNSNVLLKSFVVNYYSGNNLMSKNVEKRYKNKKVYYTLTKKYRTSGPINYYYLVDLSSNKKTTKNTYDKYGKKLTTTVNKYDKNNKLITKQLSELYSNARKKKVSSTNYDPKTALITGKTIEYRKNNKNNNLTSKQFYYYKKGKKTHREIKYYHVTTFKYVGLRKTTYDTKGIVLSDVKTTYYSDLKKKYAVTTYYYTNNVKNKQITYYYEYNGKKLKNVEKRYNTSGKTTYDLTLNYVNGLPSLKTGYTYQTKTYSYNYHLYSQGVERMKDKTTYLNNTITKTKYERVHYDKNKKVIRNESYDYQNGELPSTQKKVLKPVESAIIISPSWFYPPSFGGGWHPGIDIATYSVKKSDNKTYTKAQPIKLNFKKATVLSRYNKCHSTSSWGCGNNAYGGGGLGNYVLLATEIDGKFYTILYAHQLKLIEDNDTYKTLSKKDKLADGYQQDQTIGYVGSSGNSTGHHIHLQIQEHFYAKSIADVKKRFEKEGKNILFNVSYYGLGNGNDIFVVNPDVIFNLKYNKSW